MHDLYSPEPKSEASDNILEGLTFVITGAVHDYKNRDEFKTSVEARGGKVAGSVSAKTSFLVNNDITSTSGKNAKAKELNIPIISEDEFISRFGK
jgi:DNA ligase (NAD+)